jgi:class 3 adenylate cyclase
MVLERVERKQVTIFAVAVEGYSPFMRADEEATLKTFGDYREIINTLIARHNGRVRQGISLSRFLPIVQIATGNGFDRNRAALSS